VPPPAPPVPGRSATAFTLPERSITFKSLWATEEFAFNLGHKHLLMVGTETISAFLGGRKIQISDPPLMLWGLCSARTPCLEVGSDHTGIRQLPPRRTPSTPQAGSEIALPSASSYSWMSTRSNRVLYSRLLFGRRSKRPMCCLR
jgi:hypothetical protein